LRHGTSELRSSSKTVGTAWPLDRGSRRVLSSILMSIRAFPISRLDFISPLATAEEKHGRKNSAAKVARVKKPSVMVLSI
jgi:hypothetical protein